MVSNTLKGVVLGLLSFVLSTMVVFSATGTLPNITVTTHVKPRVIVRVYQEATCITENGTIAFALVEAGDTVFREFWLKNEGKKEVTLKSRIKMDSPWAIVWIEPMDGLIEPISFAVGQVRGYKVWETVSDNCSEGDFSFRIEFYEP